MLEEISSFAALESDVHVDSVQVSELIGVDVNRFCRGFRPKVLLDVSVSPGLQVIDDFL